jgi:kynurenine formamidase
MAELIDLTHVLNENTPAFPVFNCPRFHKVADYSDNGFYSSRIESGLHVGTHMDAPLHFIHDGPCIAEVPLEAMTGTGHLIDARGLKRVGVELLDGIEVKPGDILIVMTGFYKKYGTSEYTEQFPEISIPFAEKAVELGISLIGMDSPSPDRPPFRTHLAFLSNGVLIVENLNNLEALVGVGSFRIHAYPPSYKAEAAPVRVVAEVGGRP